MQKKATNLQDATAFAVDMSRTQGYVCIVLFRGEYFVEDENPFVRNGEELTAEYRDGELITDS